MIQDSREEIVELTQFPDMETGAPEPLILANEHRCALVYYLNAHPSRDCGYEIVRARSDAEMGPVVFVKMEVWLMHFGYPNGEALGGHPLFKRGLRAFSVQEVIDSTWPSELERANRVHPNHFPEMFDRLRHIIF